MASPKKAARLRDAEAARIAPVFFGTQPPEPLPGSLASDSLFGDVISRYTRAQALADGVLVDLAAGELAEVARNAGFRIPVACTARVFAACVALTPAAKRACNDVKGRAWDVLFMLAAAIKRTRDGSMLTFGVYVVRDRVRPTLTSLVCQCGPGDDGEPVLTVMFPGED